MVSQTLSHRKCSHKHLHSSLPCAQINIIHSPPTLATLKVLSWKFKEIESNSYLLHRTQYQNPLAATEQED